MAKKTRTWIKVPAVITAQEARIGPAGEGEAGPACPRESSCRTRNAPRGARTAAHAGHKRRGRPYQPCLVALLALAFLLPAAGCGSQAAKYAREARASYISARAVLVGVKELPSRMELVLRQEDPAALVPEARARIEEARSLVSESYAAFRAVQEKIGLLEGERDEKFAPYGQKLSALVALNTEVINAYAEYLGFCNSVVEGIPYQDKPQNLMPALSGMDKAIKRAQELTSEIERQEQETEALYRKLAA